MDGPIHTPSSANNPLSEETTALQTKLSQKIGPEYLKIEKDRHFGDSGSVTLEEWQLINLANEVFGFDGWSSNVVSLTVDYMEKNTSSGLYDIGVTAIVRVTLKSYDGDWDGGVYHEGDGYCTLENGKRGLALTECKRRAVSDALQGALRCFGNFMGNCLHDKAYTDGILKVYTQGTFRGRGGIVRGRQWPLGRTALYR